MYTWSYAFDAAKTTLGRAASRRRSERATPASGAPLRALSSYGRDARDGGGAGGDDGTAERSRPAARRGRRLCALSMTLYHQPVWWGGSGV